ncbi:FxSxx-COOH system tetratricopeptide repeat protein [Ktedonospora formicarum]|nr:FxSxx-COOH system tetratricopeptide repeat protein [Ktedonospora formicarum]
MISNGSYSFGALLHTFRKRKRLTQRQLAAAIGMHSHAISRWELGEVLPASKAIVLELARRLHLNDQETRDLLEASLSAPVPLWGVPIPRNLFFTGREEMLRVLQMHLLVNGSAMAPQVYALHGLGGIGKTQLALEYAYRHALDYRAILWIEAETSERVWFSLQRIAELLQLPERVEMDQQRVAAAVSRWLTTHDQWLLIWDNVEDPELPQRMLSPSIQGVQLFTTRRQALGTLAQGVELHPMGEEEGILLLLRRAKVLESEASSEQVHQLAERVPSEYRAASQLVTALGGLPLALDQAGAYLEETSCSLTDYLQRYEQHRALLLDRRGSPEANHPRSVTTTFLLAKEQVKREQQAAADLLDICAFLNVEAIPEELFQVGATHLEPTLAAVVVDPIQFDMALAALRNLSLVQRQARTHTLSLHRLTQGVLRAQMEGTKEYPLSKQVIRMVNAAFPSGDFGTWAQCERHLAQAIACVPLIEVVGSEVSEAFALLFRVGRYLLKRGRFEEARPLLAHSVVLGEQHYGPNHPELIPHLMDLAELSWRQGEYEQAEALLSRVLVIEDQHLGSIYVQQGETLNNLGLLSWEQGKYAQAESLYQQAMQIQEQALGPNHLVLTDTLNNLGLLYWKQGKYSQAEPLYQRTLQIREQMLGPEHPEIAQPLTNLAALYCNQRRYAQAESLYQRALCIQERALGQLHPGVALILNNLATLYRSLGQMTHAEPLYQRALQIREHVLGPKHALVAFSLNGLADLYTEQGEYEQAEPLYKRALDIREQALGLEHSDVALSLGGLARLYTKQDKCAQAKLLYERAIHISELSLGHSHSKTIEIRTAYHAMLGTEESVKG